MNNEAKPGFHLENEVDDRPGFALTWENEDAVDILLLAARSLENHDLSKAIEFVEAAIKLDPHWFKSYLTAGQMSLRHQKIPEAIHWFQKCLELGFNEAPIYDHLSKAYYESKDLNRALLFLEKLIEFQPKDLAASLRKIRWLSESSRWMEVEEFFQANESTIKEAGEAHLWRCLAVAHLERIDEARLLFEEATLRSKRQYPEIVRQIVSIIGHSYRKW